MLTEHSQHSQHSQQGNFGIVVRVYALPPFVAPQKVRAKLVKLSRKVRRLTLLPEKSWSQFLAKVGG